MGCPHTHVEGASAATLASCEMEPPAVSQVDGDVNILYTRLNPLPEGRATEQRLSLLVGGIKRGAGCVALPYS